MAIGPGLRAVHLLLGPARTIGLLALAEQVEHVGQPQPAIAEGGVACGPASPVLGALSHRQARLVIEQQLHGLTSEEVAIVLLLAQRQQIGLGRPRLWDPGPRVGFDRGQAEQQA